MTGFGHVSSCSITEYGIHVGGQEHAFAILQLDTITKVRERYHILNGAQGGCLLLLRMLVKRFRRPMMNT